MVAKTPLTIITGSLGSGKTTLLQHILDTFPQKIAILMNEFGQISIDSKILKGKNIEMVELAGGCVCCSLIGEFEEAVKEIIDTFSPMHIVVETTGIAEPDALVLDVQDTLAEVRLDGIITVVDADLMLRFPKLGHTTRMQIEDADILALNKTDLVSKQDLLMIRDQLKEINPLSPLIPTTYCRLDPDLLFGLSREHSVSALPHQHQVEYSSVSFTTEKIVDKRAFKNLVDELKNTVIRAKGFVNFSNGTYLFNFVNGRWELEPTHDENTALVFIGKDFDKETLLKKLAKTEVKS